MSESERGGPAFAADTQPDPPGGAALPRTEHAAGWSALQAGAMLRQLRQTAGVDQMLLASALKVGPSKIQALEEGRLSDLPGLTFARGLASAICRYFAVDSAPVLALMPQAVPGMSVESRNSREPFKPLTFHTGSDGLAASRPGAGIPGWLLAVVAILLIGALAVWLMPTHILDGSGAQALAPAGTAPGAASDPEAQPSPALGPQALPAAVAAAQSASAAAVPEVVASGQHGSIVEQDVVTFNATGRVWLGIHDGSGKSILNRILTGGDTLSVGGELPLSVTVGDRTAVTVAVRGQPLDLGKSKRDSTVARFEVNPVGTP